MKSFDEWLATTDYHPEVLQKLGILNEMIIAYDAGAREQHKEDMEFAEYFIEKEYREIRDIQHCFKQWEQEKQNKL